MDSSHSTTLRRDPGQALIELAFVGMLLATMCFGVLEFGRAYYASISVTHAARDGARIAMDQSKSNAEVVDAAEAAAGTIELSAVSVSRAENAGEYSTVTVTYDFEAIVPFVSEIWGGGSLEITRTISSRLEEIS